MSGKIDHQPSGQARRRAARSCRRCRSGCAPAPAAARAAAGLDADRERLAVDGVAVGLAQRDRAPRGAGSARPARLLAAARRRVRWRRAAARLRRPFDRRRRRRRGCSTRRLWRGGGAAARLRCGRRAAAVGGRGLRPSAALAVAPSRRDRLHEPGRLPAQVLAALAEVAIVRVLAAAALAGPHYDSSFFFSSTPSRAAGRSCAPALTARSSARSPPARARAPACRSRRRTTRRRGLAASPGRASTHAALVLDAQRHAGEAQLERQLEPAHGAAPAAQLGRAAHHLALLLELLGLVELDPEPRGHQRRACRAARSRDRSARAARRARATIGSSSVSSAPMKRIPKSPSW